VSGVAAGRRTVGRAGPDPGREVHELWLDSGRMRVAVLDYGATLVEVLVPDRSGTRRNVALRLPDLAAYLAAGDRAYVGSTMGRFARIVPHGRLELDGRRHQLVPNAGPHHIHGGPDGFDARVWDASAGGGADRGRIVLTLTSPDGDQGYPGTLACSAHLELDLRGRLTIRYEATTDRTTLCGLSNHVFWNLAGSGTIDAHLLQLNAAQVLEQVPEGQDVVPTGRVVPAAGTAADLRAARRLQDIALDAFFPLTGGAGWVARLLEPESGRRLVIDSDQSGMAVYTGDGLPGRPRAGICLQPGPWPCAAGLPSSVLRPGQTYRSRTTFALDVVEEARFVEDARP
jgi:aldose 1-epimerase